MSNRRLGAPLRALAALLLAASTAGAGERWTAEKAADWSRAMPWLVGCNFSPSTAINQLEMWQAETFDPATIDRELGWAEGLGFTSVRVFLHDLAWSQDRDGFLGRMDRFLAIADRHKIGVMFVLLDSCWDPNPKAGPQRAPRPGLHNSGWVQSPGRAILGDPSRHGELEGYVKGVVGRFKDDRRVQAWDVINEPENGNGSSYGKEELKDKEALATALMRRAFAWAREVGPSQPLTAGVWQGEWGDPAALSGVNRAMLDLSDVVSFHDYRPLDGLKARVGALKRLGRPIFCTEYMARPAGSRFDPNLAYLKAEGVGAYNWGFVDGKTQTIYPWDSWQTPYAAEPPAWFHDIFRRDGAPYDAREVAFIRALTGKAAPRP